MISRLAPLLFLAGSLSAAVTQTPVFVSGEGGYHTYRIPSVVLTAKGTVVAVCEGRKTGGGDAGEIDLVERRSSDGGVNWGAQQLIWHDGTNTCGNPCLVQDRDTGTLWLFSTHNLGSDKEAAIESGRSVGTRTVWVLHSDDDGATWTSPAEITSSVKDPHWDWYATGPGVGIQVESGPHPGRIVIPANHSLRSGEGAAARRESVSHVFYSDDHGKTWVLGGSVQAGTNESEVVELFDGKGTLMLNMRSSHGRGHRRQSISADGGLTWAPFTESSLIEPGCQGSIIRGDDSGVILFSNPSDPHKRINLIVRASTDNAASWSNGLVVAPGIGAYSCLVALGNGRAGCLYEGGPDRGYQQILFARFTLAEAGAKQAP